MKLTKLFTSFFESEKAGGLILLICTAFSLLISNSSFSESYFAIWHHPIANHSFEHWINDGLMAIFFLMIGLELEREVYIGELSKLKEAILPISGALGGMIFPALIFLLFNFGTETQSGIGIPMATDIAFALGVLSLVGKNVPNSLKVFLTALAVIDDLGAIIVIALFYTKTLYFVNLIISLSIFAGLLVLNRMKVNNLWIYLLAGVFMWYFMLNSGVHATITGVLLAFAIPFQDGSENTISYKLEQFLHKPVAFFILPLFALCNTAIVIGSDWLHNFSKEYSLGIIFGLVIGKPLGIVLFTFLMVKLRITQLPEDLNWKKIIGVGFLAGIGFTMSIFITLLAFDNVTVINNAKFMILVASLLSGIIGFLSFKVKNGSKIV
ncbi:Na+/H+ antiporter NhaA [Flavobacterium celericrescens]|uniref:Na(+)/H(+) antiporter NhaA n=1 Tax=Flavobacterium celericrescens TaxID=2709780 RepID=A0ABX0IHW5_9FLAO|nr:Na+/H+ antiporter NhaA [Flavobacterium celericrescens]NHM05474.1 Na+/H+ antiporter NhaA [Flavobacterium celericrescens]